jgi:DNA-binding transcriptional ArsR family regulator
MMREYEAVLKAAGDPNRVRLLKMLEGGEMCVCQLVAALSLAQSTVSKHLALLHAAGLVEQRKEGRWVQVRLAKTAVNDYAQPLLRLLQEWLQDDEVIKNDARRIFQIKRMPAESLCCAKAAELVDAALARKGTK